MPLVSVIGRHGGKLSKSLCIFAKLEASAGRTFFDLIAVNSASVISPLFFSLRKHVCNVLNQGVIVGSQSIPLNLFFFVKQTCHWFCKILLM